MSIQKGCSGACDQGRRECLTPYACELEEKIDHKYAAQALNNLIVTVLIFMIACCSYFIWEAICR